MKALCNLLAVREPDPLLRTALTARLQSEPGWSVRTTGWWVLAVRPVGMSAVGWIGEEHAALAEGRETLMGRVIDSDPAALTRTLSSGVKPLERLPGDFTAFIVGDDELIVVRSAAGVVPVYVRGDPERPAAATRLGDLVRYVLSDPRLDPMANAAFSTACCLPGDATFVRGVRILPCGTRASSSRDFRPERYWDPRLIPIQSPRATTSQEHAARLRSLLVLNLKAQLADSGNLLTLSGGIDSSALACLAGRRLGRRLSTLTFLPQDPRTRGRDQYFVDSVLGALGNGVECSWSHLLTAELRYKLLCEAPREVFQVVHPALCLLPKLQLQTPLRTYFGGEFADALFGSLTVQDDWMATSTLADVLRYSHAAPYVARHVRTWAGFRLRLALRRPNLWAQAQGRVFSDEISRACTDWYRDRQRAIARSRHGRPFLQQRLERAANIIAMNWEVTSSRGVHRSFPFFSRELVELAYASHPLEALSRGGKRVLRAAVRNDLPAAVRGRLDKGTSNRWFGAQFNWNEPLPDELGGLIREDWFPKPPRWLEASDALRLRGLVNIVDALRTRGSSGEF
jgi:asparagine synthetase B (glutamine-hydrolysing)